jgi:hypothetical protein
MVKILSKVQVRGLARRHGLRKTDGIQGFKCPPDVSTGDDSPASNEPAIDGKD